MGAVILEDTNTAMPSAIMKMTIRIVMTKPVITCICMLLLYISVVRKTKPTFPSPRSTFCPAMSVTY